ncbi:uncharacterized protein ACRADG_013241 isoform 2-T4 [Cochliomyia hominivorax]
MALQKNSSFRSKFPIGCKVYSYRHTHILATTKVTNLQFHTRKYRINTHSNVCIDGFRCISTDATSLDGLLNTISCGSNFSNPSSTVQYQNTFDKMAANDKIFELSKQRGNESMEEHCNEKYSKNIEYKVMKSSTEYKINQTESIYKKQVDTNHSETKKTSSLKIVYANTLKVSDNDRRSYHTNFKNQNFVSNHYRMPTQSLSLPRKPLSSGMVKKDNSSTRTHCGSRLALKPQFKDIDISLNSITNPKPPYYCPTSYTSSNSSNSCLNHILSVKDLKEHFQFKERQQLFYSNGSQEFDKNRVKGNDDYNIVKNNSYVVGNINEKTILCPELTKALNNLKISKDYGEKFTPPSSTKLQTSSSILTELDKKNLTTITHDILMSKKLSNIPINNQGQIQLQLQQNPKTRQLFAIIHEKIYQPKPTNIYKRNDELSGSYASLECPSPPGPPSTAPDVQIDSQNRLADYLKNMYQEIAFKEQKLPEWSSQTTCDALSIVRFEPELRFNLNSHGINDYLTVDQLLISIQTKDGNYLEAPRRCLVECPSWTSRKNLGLRILHAWSKGPMWPSKGISVGLTLFIPLLELKRSFAHFLEKELLPKGSLNPFHNIPGGFCGVWRSLEALGPKLLIILDGYTSQKHLNSLSSHPLSPRKLKGSVSEGGMGLNINGFKCQFPSDVHDLLDGKLFPEARIIILANCSNCSELMPIVQRHVMYEGLSWGRSASILEGGHWGGPSRLINLLHEGNYLRKAIRTPLACLAVTTIYENSNGHLPEEELDIIEAIFNCVSTQVLPTTVSELGRLALFCLKRKRAYITMSEMKTYCSATISIIDCFEKNILFGKTAKRKEDYVFYPICEGMLEYLAAKFIASLVYKPGVLSAEITGLAISDELDEDILKVLKYSMSMLGDQAHVLLSKLTPLWLSPLTVFSLALAGTQSEENIAALCDILGISKNPPISPLETKPLWVQVRSTTSDLMGWGMALKSSTCTLKNLELIYHLEKQNLVETRKALDIFLDSMTRNESVLTLRLSSLIEMDVKDSEISYLANCVSKLLLKPKLENFELVITLIEEDPPILKLQSVVAALCRSLPLQIKLNSLLLDLGLCTSQLVQICTALENCPNLNRLSLPHLRCERGAVSTLASLVKSRPINFLSLPSCWGARDDPPSSSGISSGSGSSTATSCLIKQGSLPGVPSPKAYAPGVFSSLPRGIFVPQSSLGRSATLPRQPINHTIEKRSCESVVSKIWYPTPSCDGVPHNSGALHDLFVVKRDNYSNLHGLDLSKAQFTLEDSMCLGETVRISNTLHTLKLEGLSRISDILPSILGASESHCLQMLSIGSQRLNLDDTVIAMCARALTNCSALRLLSIDGWSLRVENVQTLSTVRAFLSLTSIREFSLANCRLYTSLIKPDLKAINLFECRSVIVLKLSGAQIILPDLSVIRGPQLLKFISGFPCLRELDLSSPARSGIETTHFSALILNDKTITNFFQILHLHFGLLNTLKMCNWVIHFDEMQKSIKTIRKALRNSPISHLNIDGILVLDRLKKKRSESIFIQCLFSSLSFLRWMGLSLAGKKEDQISAIGNAVTDLKGFEIEIKLSESTIDQAKLMAQVISLDGKFDIKVSTFGTSSGILIHAEKCRNKSLNRKIKN